MIHVIVRDARMGRDPALVTYQGGQVLREFDTDTTDALDLNDWYYLSEDEPVRISARREEKTLTGVTITIEVTDGPLPRPSGDPGHRWS